MASFPRLDQDTLDLIIDRCALHTPTLRSLALVCKNFLPEAQKCIFETVELTATEDDAKSRRLHARFHSVISTRPHIAGYVREFLVRDMSDVDDPPENERSSWIRDEPDFLQTLSILTAAQVQRFTLETDLYWSSFPALLKDAFLRLFCSSSLKYLGLSGLLSFPRSCCPVLRHLQELSLVGVFIDDDQDADYPTGWPDARPLSWLMLEDIPSECIHLLARSLWPNAIQLQSGRAFPALEAVHVGPSAAGEVEAVCSFIQATRKTLKYLHWEYSLKFDLPGPFDFIPLDLSQFERLYWLTIEIPTNDSFHEDDYFVGLVSLLETSSPESELSVLHFTVYFSDPEEAKISFAYHESWQDLQQTLTQNRLPLLTEVHITIYLAEMRGITPEDSYEIQQLAVGRLRALYERSILTIRVECGE